MRKRSTSRQHVLQQRRDAAVARERARRDAAVHDRDRVPRRARLRGSGSATAPSPSARAGTAAARPAPTRPAHGKSNGAKKSRSRRQRPARRRRRPWRSWSRRRPCGRAALPRARATSGARGQHLAHRDRVDPDATGASAVEGGAAAVPSARGTCAVLPGGPALPEVQGHRQHEQDAQQEAVDEVQGASSGPADGPQSDEYRAKRPRGRNAARTA